MFTELAQKVEHLARKQQESKNARFQDEKKRSTAAICSLEGNASNDHQTEPFLTENIRVPQDQLEQNLCENAKQRQEVSELRHTNKSLKIKCDELMNENWAAKTAPEIREMQLNKGIHVGEDSRQTDQRKLRFAAYGIRESLDEQLGSFG